MVERSQCLLYVATGVLGAHPDLSWLFDGGSILGVLCVFGRGLVPIFGLVIFADLREVRTYEWSMPASVMEPLQDHRVGFSEGNSHGDGLDGNWGWAHVTRGREWFHVSCVPSRERRKVAKDCWQKKIIILFLDRWLPEEVLDFCLPGSSLFCYSEMIHDMDELHFKDYVFQRACWWLCLFVDSPCEVLGFGSQTKPKSWMYISDLLSMMTTLVFWLVHRFCSSIQEFASAVYKIGFVHSHLCYCGRTRLDGSSSFGNQGEKF